ncbi:hypothetical protein [Peptacetobacter hominis]|nr:hypothetical protein [Peptacetobacter hominis]
MFKFTFHMYKVTEKWEKTVYYTYKNLKNQKNNVSCSKDGKLSIP